MTKQEQAQYLDALHRELNFVKTLDKPERIKDIEDEIAKYSEKKKPAVKKETRPAKVNAKAETTNHG